jgi:serine/threonine-protein kinase RsbW
MTGMTSPSSAWQAQHELHTPDEMRHVLGDLVAGLRSRGYTEKEQFGIRLSLEEAIVNAIKHGHAGDTTKRVHLRYRLDALAFHAEVEDEGPGFNPAAVPDPLAPENLELPGGRGVFLMRHYMSAVRFNVSGNCVMLSKMREGAEANGAVGSG